VTTTSVLDFNVSIDRNTPLWSETRWNGCWSEPSGAGLFIHAGRFRRDLGLWWVHFAAYLPDGRLVVDRIWCRDSTRAGLRSDTLDLEMTATGWCSTFDGVCDLTDTEALARSPRGSSAPLARVRWDVTATAAAPVWSLEGGAVKEGSEIAGSMHVQQAFRTAGSLEVDGTIYDLDGVGFKDHSAGTRDWRSWHSHRFMLAVMPDYSVHAVGFCAPDGTEHSPVGAVMTGGEQRLLECFESPRLESVLGAPHASDIVVSGPDGPVTLAAEVVHTLPLTITDDNENINGVDWELAGDPICFAECVVRLTAPDGAVGFGHFERSARRSALRRP